MAKTKPTFNKLKLSSELESKELTWNDQIIEIKQYLPIQDKLIMISDIINAAADENRFPNYGKIHMFLVLYTIYNYTNIVFTDKQKEEPAKIYDAFVSSGLKEAIYRVIPNNEYLWFDDMVYSIVDEIYRYQNSAYGILDAVGTDYNNLDLDIQKLTEGITNRENIEYLDQVLTKVG